MEWILNYLNSISMLIHIVHIFYSDAYYLYRSVLFNFFVTLYTCVYKTFLKDKIQETIFLLM